MKKKFSFLLFIIASAFFSHAQVRIGLLAGANRATILETNNLPNWNTIKPNYAPVYGFHGGAFADFPLNRKHNISFQPSVIYFNKGRKYSRQFDSTASTPLIMDSGFKQLLNYIDIPLNFVMKFPLVKKVKFFLGGGPYASFFFKGSEKLLAHYRDGTVISNTNHDLPVGNAPGKYSTLDYGFNATAGFEIGPVLLKADYSQSLTDIYKAKNYTGSFKNQVMSASIGMSMDIPSTTPEKKKTPVTAAKKTKPVNDRDGDGINDKSDRCPDQAGTKATKGCPDRDGDGVADIDDKCPDEKGSIANKGCPVKAIVKDTDGDGVPDDVDKCPTIKGSAKYDGCPVPDSDGDGIPDDVDKCPDVKGLLRYNGCPIPDTDGDGVNDEIDHCKDVPGLKSNHGCPLNPEQENQDKEVVRKVNYSTGKIQFEVKKADLLPSSLEALDNIAKLLMENPALKASIEGHASLEGDYFRNLKLSEDRAVSVKNYLVSKGIDASRLTTVGYGSARVLTIEPSEQAINRRVEMKLYR